MRDFVWLQLGCILTPAVLAAGIWFLIDLLQSGEQRLGIRIHLSSLLVLFPVIGVMLLVTRTFADELTVPDRIHICIVSLFTIPLLWFVQTLIDCWRDALEQCAVQREREVVLDRMLAKQAAAREEN